jgi:hypothetical protein
LYHIDKSEVAQSTEDAVVVAQSTEDAMIVLTAGLAFMGLLTVMLADIWQALQKIRLAIRKAAKVMQRP